MFKSVFGKYFSTVTVVIVVGFTMLFLIVYGVINNFSSNAKQESATQVAKAVRTYVESELVKNGTLDVTEDANITWMLELAATSTDQMTVMIMGEEGNLVAAANNFGDEVPDDIRLPNNIMASLQAGNEVSGVESFRGALGTKQLIYAEPVMFEDSRMCGAVVVCSPTARWSALHNELTKTLLMASLWVVLASMIAVWFISERVSAPLRDMRAAAKDFSAGKFDRRVTATGRDEIAELGLALNQMAQSLDNLEMTRNQFISNVSHDLRTPMTTISGFIDAIRDGVIPPEKQDHYLEIISAEIHRLSRLVNSLLDLSRIQAGTRNFVMKPFDVCEMARQILISSEQRIEEKQLAVEFLCDEERMTAVADRDAVYQVFYNICDNAIKFSRPGGALQIAVTKMSEKGFEKNKILISVYNQGEGIAAEDLPFVFDRFYKGDKSRGLDKKGAGLGLYIAKTIINAHGGEIWVSSEAGKDCKFSFTLAEEVSHVLHAARDEAGERHRETDDRT